MVQFNDEEEGLAYLSELRGEQGTNWSVVKRDGHGEGIHSAGQVEIVIIEERKGDWRDSWNQLDNLILVVGGMTEQNRTPQR